MPPLLAYVLLGHGNDVSVGRVEMSTLITMKLGCRSPREGALSAAPKGHEMRWTPSFTMSLVFALTLAPMASARNWTDSTGRYSVEAEFVSLADGIVRLRRHDGKTMEIPLEKLRQADQAYVQQMSEKSNEDSPFVAKDTPGKPDPSAMPSPGGSGEPAPVERSQTGLAQDDRRIPEPGGGYYERLTVDPSVPLWGGRVETPEPGGGHYERPSVDPSVPLWGGGVETPEPGGEFRSAIDSP